MFRCGFPEATPWTLIGSSWVAAFEELFKRQYDPVNGYVAIPTLQRNTIRGEVTIRDQKNTNARSSLNFFRDPFSWNKVHLVRLRWFGFERRVSQGHGSTVAVACNIHASLKLLR